MDRPYCETRSSRARQPHPAAAAGAAAAGAAAACPWRLPWARLLAWVFRLDLTVCPACGGPMRLIATLTDPESIRASLDGVGLDRRPPPITPPRLDPQPECACAA